MGAPDDLQLTDLAIDGLVNAQLTTIIVDSDIFEPVRAAAARYLPPPLDDLLACYLCTGTWVGIFQAGRRGGRRLFIRRALTIACVGRLVRTLTILADRSP
jgi:hypothetical protein